MNSLKTNLTLFAVLVVAMLLAPACSQCLAVATAEAERPTWATGLKGEFLKNGDLKITWDKQKDAQNYILYGFKKEVVIGETKETFYIIEKGLLLPSTEYDFDVKIIYQEKQK